MRNNKLWISLCIILIVISLAIFVQSQIVLTPLTNPQVKGWLFGKDVQFCGSRTWATTGAVDTLLITGLTDDDAIFVFPRTTQIENLYATISANDDTAFVNSDSAGTAPTDKYFYFVIKNAKANTD